MRELNLSYTYSSRVDVAKEVCVWMQINWRVCADIDLNAHFNTQKFNLDFNLEIERPEAPWYVMGSQGNYKRPVIWRSCPILPVSSSLSESPV